MSERKILGSTWFNTVGIVKVENEYGEIEYFIGVGEGYSQREDEIKIADWGSRFDPAVLETL